MKKADAGFDLRISAQWVMILIATAAIWFLSANTRHTARPEYIQTQLLGARLFCLMVALWLVLWKWPRVGRWLLVLAFSMGVVFTRLYFALPGMLALLALPVGIAVAFISVRAGALVVVLQTLLLFALRRNQFATGGEVAVSLFATWSTFGILCGVYYPVYQLADWAWSRYQESRILIEEARGRRAELEQTLQHLRRANRQLALDNQRMSGLRAVAEEAQRNKTAFVSRVSHEFRAPLNMIIGLAGLMVDRPEIYAEELPPDLRTDLEVIYRNSSHLAEMINDVLDLSQTEMGRLALHLETTDFVDIVAEALQAVSPLIHKKGLTLEELLPASPLPVYCDRTRIRQVLLNLLSNAARFTDVGTITVVVSGTESEIVVEVADTGSGIGAEALQHIFEPFYRAPSTSRAVTGSGLGLSISREIVQHHGGRIWVDSQPGLGTHFHFSLPAQEPAAPTARPGHQIVQEWVWQEESFRTERAVREPGFSRPYLIVQDPEDTLVHALENHGPEVEFVITRTEDACINAALEYPAHAILVNTHTDGAESTALLDRFVSAAPSALAIACDVQDPLARARAAGANAYLVKPISRESLSRAFNGLERPVKSLLIVDDDVESVEMITRIIRLLAPSVEVDTAGTVAAALAAMEAYRPDLVLLDVIMPGDDGWSALAAMRADPHLADVPVFFVTGADPSDAPPISEHLTVAVDGGISTSRLVEVSLELCRVLLGRHSETDETPAAPS